MTKKDLIEAITAEYPQLKFLEAGGYSADDIMVIKLHIEAHQKVNPCEASALNFNIQKQYKTILINISNN